MQRSRSPLKPNSLNMPIIQDKLKIIIRIRPILNEQEQTEFVKLEDDNTLQIRRPGNHTYMKFSNIVPPHEGQKEVFELVQDSIRQFLSGINVTLFAYGQTGAGKTYSMIGNYSPNQSTENLFNFLSSKERGVLSRSLEVIMKFAEEQDRNYLKMFVSFYEIYNEKIFDLYNNTMTPLEIQSKNGEISIPDLVTVEIGTMEEAIHYLMIGLKNRATGSTHANAQSSRSHSIFQIAIQKQDEQGSKTTSLLRIVDLAGSEKFKMPSDLSKDEKETRIQELTNINSSLSVLGHCISALIEKSRTHIPFRDSKLTRILSDSLLGQGKMRFIICISPSISAQLETFSTLQFANRAKRAIFERSESKTPQMNKRKSESQEVLRLKKELEKERQTRILMQNQMKDLISNRPDHLIKENAYLRRENEKLKEQVRNLMTKQHKVHPHPQYIPTEDKENNLKAEMLKLPIFQNNKSRSIVQSESRGQPMNRKKAEFQKKIRKFIEADSPVHAQRARATQNLMQEYSFEQMRGPQYQEGKQIMDIGMDEDDLWDEHNDTRQLIEKTCEKMNVHQFKDLKKEMHRAQQQLFNLRKKDSEIETRNSIVR